MNVGVAKVQDSDVLGDLYLFVSTTSAVLAWDVHAMYAGTCSTKDHLIFLTKHPNPIHSLHVSQRTGFVVVCSEGMIPVISLDTDNSTIHLQGHIGAVNTAAFCNVWKGLVATGGDDRTVKLWNLLAGELVYDSGILGSASIRSICMEPTCPRMAVGFASGIIRVFDLTSLPECRCLQVTPIWPVELLQYCVMGTMYK